MPSRPKQLINAVVLDEWNAHWLAWTQQRLATTKPKTEVASDAAPMIKRLHSRAILVDQQGTSVANVRARLVKKIGTSGSVEWRGTVCPITGDDKIEQ